MGLVRWFTHNVADTDTGTHADVKPLELPIRIDEAASRLGEVIAKFPDWGVEVIDAEGRVLALTHRTKLFRLVDDVTLRLEANQSGTIVHAHSQSRIGKGDLGQNRRNILGLFHALRNTIK